MVDGEGDGEGEAEGVEADPAFQRDKAQLPPHCVDPPPLQATEHSLSDRLLPPLTDVPQ